jgi:outer membrane receptor for ferrienterochelin and colicins
MRTGGAQEIPMPRRPFPPQGLLSLACSVAGLLWLPSSPAAEPAESAAALSGVTVTAATRTREPAEEVTATVEVLTGEEMRQNGATMLDEALRAQSSIYMGPDGNAFSIRGGSKQDMIYLLDGRRLRGNSGRSFELNRIPVSYVERVEIVKGPGSVVYGSDAVAGVINVITRRPGEGLEASLEAHGARPTSADGGDRNNGAFFVGGGSRDTRFRLMADVMEREAYSEKAVAEVEPEKETNELPESYRFDEDLREEADVSNLRGSLSHWVNDDVRLALDAGLTEEGRDWRSVHARPPVETGYTDDSGEPVRASQIPDLQEEDVTRRDLAATAEWLATDTLDLRYRLYQSRYHLERARTFLDPEAFGFSSRAASDFGAREVTITDRVNDLHATWEPSLEHTLLSGLEHNRQSYRDHLLAGEPKDSQWVAGAYAQHQWQTTERLKVVYGARYDDSSGDVDNTSLQGGAVYRLNGGVRLRARYAEGFKVPELRSYYVRARNPRGDRVLGAYVEDEALGKGRHELDPQRSRNYELGAEGRLPFGATTFHYDLGLFYTEFNDRITRTWAPGRQYLTFRNVNDARTQGAETALGLRFPAFEWKVAATWLDAIDRDTRNRLPDAPPLTAMVSAAWMPVDPLRLQARVRHVGERYQDSANTMEDDAYTLTSLDAGYEPVRWPGLTLRAGVENLFDADNDNALESDAGRRLEVGFRYEFQ